MRTELNDALKSAMKEKDGLATSTLRLIQAALKDRDIATASPTRKSSACCSP
jgi:uncharacterized protein YqeY